MSTPPGIEQTIQFENKKEYELDNNYIIHFSYNEELLFIEVKEMEDKNTLPQKEYNIFLNLEQLKVIDNYFLQFMSLNEVMDSFDELIKMKCLYIIKEEKNIKIKIINPILKKKEIYINMPMIEKDVKNQIDSILLYIKSLNNTINKMKTEYDNKIKLLEEKIKQNENKIEKLENRINENVTNKGNSYPKLKSVQNKNKEIFINNNDIDSKIIENIQDISFINEKLENNFNGKINYNLIYRATRDGPKTNDFNKNCNGKNNQLIILKTTKGFIFGGFTERGFQNTNEGKIKDDSVFLFSLNNKKIYDIKKGSYAMYEYAEKKFGIFFGKSDGNNPIFLGSQNCDMLLNKNYTCQKNNEEYSFTFDYELNGGEKKFQLEEIEVFQITNFKGE
jgi:hypothetical protein